MMMKMMKNLELIKFLKKKIYDYIGAVITQNGFVEHDDAFYHPNIDLKFNKKNMNLNVTTGYRLVNNK
jgi:hypothetical protein